MSDLDEQPQHPGDPGEQPRPTTTLEIPVSGTATSTIAKWLECGLNQNMSGEALRLYLSEKWQLDDFVNPESHRDKRFFEELRNTLRDHGISCHSEGMAKSLPIGQKIVQYIWSDLPEAKLRDFKEAATIAKRDRATPQMSAHDNRNASPSRGGISHPGPSTRQGGFDPAPLKAFTTGLYSLLSSLEEAYSLRDNHERPEATKGWNKTSSADFRVAGTDGRSPTIQHQPNTNTRITAFTPTIAATKLATTNVESLHIDDGNKGENTKSRNDNNDKYHGLATDADSGKAYSTQEYRLQQATRQVIDFYNKKPQFAGSIDEDWPRHCRQFLTLCQVFKTTDDDHAQIFIHSLEPGSAAHQLLETLSDSGRSSWHNIMLNFNSRFYNEATRERVLNRLNQLRIESYREQNDVDDNKALKKLVTDIDKLCGMVLPVDRTPQSRRRYLNNAILGTDWSHHARSKIRANEELGDVIAILHESIDYMAVLKRSTGDKAKDTYGNKPSTILYGANNWNDESPPPDDQSEYMDDTENVLYQRMFSQHPHAARRDRYGRNSGHDSRFKNRQRTPFNYRHRYENNSHNGSSSNNYTHGRHNQPKLGCFNCLRIDCRVSRCPLPRDPARIRANITAWKAMRGARQPHNNIHVADVHLFDSEEVLELANAEAMCASINETFLTNTFLTPAQTQSQSQALNRDAVHLTPSNLPPSPHTTFQVPSVPVHQPATTQLTNNAQTNQQPAGNNEFSHHYFLDDYDDIDFCHAITHDEIHVIAEYNIPTDFIMHTEQKGFLGFCLDSGAASTVSGQQQFDYLMAITQQPVRKFLSKTRFRFGKTVTSTDCRYKLRVPLSQGHFIEVQVAVVQLDIPFLIGLEALVHYGLNLDFYRMRLRYQESNISVPISIFDKHAYIHARPYPQVGADEAMILYNRQELRKLHMQFFHPRPTQLYNLIKRAKPREVDSDTLNILKEISANCTQCQEFHASPLRFRVAIPETSISFNADVAFDLVWLDGRPVLHVVDLQTRFQNAVFIRSKTTETIWQAFIDIWSSTYTGFPATLHFDQESSFVSADMERNCAEQGISLSVSGIESHNSIGAGESYHRQLRRVFNCIRSETPNVEPEHALRLAIKAINDTAGSNGLVPSMLVFGTVPSFPASPRHNPKQRERFAALKAARDEMSQIVCEKRLNDALRRKLPDSTSYLIRPGDNVRVFRETSKAWDGPFQVTKLDRKLVTVTDGIKAKTFNIAQVLPCQTTVRDPKTQRELSRIFDHAIHSVEILKTTDPRYSSEASRKAIRDEIIGLESRGVFTIVDEKDIPADAIVLGMKIILAIKDGGTAEERYKARIVALGHRDRQKALLIHVAVPVRIRSLRLLLCFALPFEWDVWLEDTNQAYCQGKPLHRYIVLKAHPLFGYPEGTYLRLILPLYGLSEAGDHWDQQLKEVLRDELKATATTTDKSLFYWRPEPVKRLLGMIAIYVDDCVYGGNKAFSEKSKLVRSHFDTKRRQYPPFKFAGIHIERPTAYAFEMHQLTYIQKLTTLHPTADFKSFRTLRHQLAWTANSRPDILAGVNILSQVTETQFKESHITKINSLVNHLHNTARMKLRYVTLDPKSLQLIVFCDGSFASNEDLSSQCGYIVLMADEQGKANLLHCASAKTKRIVRSVLGAETLGLSNAADMGVSLMTDIRDMLGEQLQLHLLTDSETLFSVLIKSTTTSELRLMIDIAAAKQSFDRNEITTISWIRRRQNIADSMTKLPPNSSFVEFLRSNQLTYDIDQSVLRTNPQTQDNRSAPLADSSDPIREYKTLLADSE